MARYDYIEEDDVREKLNKRYMEFIKTKALEEEVEESVEEVEEELEEEKEEKSEETESEEETGTKKMKVTVYE